MQTRKSCETDIFRYRETKNYHQKRLNMAKNSKTSKPEPQYSFDDLYFTPFSEQRKFDEEGNIYYVPIERNTHPTGIRAFDNYLNHLSEGYSNTWQHCSEEGVSEFDFYAMCRVLTGMTLTEIRMKWVERNVLGLLRYTDLSSEEVADRSGAGSISNMHRACKRASRVSPHFYRRRFCDEDDVGKFRL
jgi:hypothetical protein